MTRDGGASGKGTLYLVATPIGNIADITERAKAVLAEADCVAAEDTRHTGLLLHRLGIDARLMSYHEHNEAARAEQIIRMLDRGEDVAVVSDAGMPGISDPGEVIVSAAVAQGFRVVPVPGPSAFVAALTASGLSTSRFFFQGFLPRKAADRRKTLKQLSSLPVTLVFYCLLYTSSLQTALHQQRGGELPAGLNLAKMLPSGTVGNVQIARRSQRAFIQTSAWWRLREIR